MQTKQLKKNEYTAFRLGMAQRAPFVATVIPFFSMALLSKYSYSTIEQIGYVSLSFSISIALFFVSSEFRALFMKINLFRISALLLYGYFSIVLPALFVFFKTNHLATFILSLSCGFSLVATLLFYNHFYSHKYMQQVDWFTTDKAILGPMPDGSPIGNKIAITLVVIIIALIAVGFNA